MVWQGELVENLVQVPRTDLRSSASRPSLFCQFNTVL